MVGSGNKNVGSGNRIVGSGNIIVGSAQFHSVFSRIDWRRLCTKTDT